MQWNPLGFGETGLEMTMNEHVGKEYELDARVYWRKSTDEWVLELSGTINDTNMSVRHSQPGYILPEDVPGLPTHYPDYDGGRSYPEHWPADAVAEIRRLQSVMEQVAALAPAPGADIPDDHHCSIPASVLRAAERAVERLPDIDNDVAPKPFG